MPVSAFYNPKLVEPAHGRRKARIECPIEGCSKPIICTRLMCIDHWRKVPFQGRRAVNNFYRMIKAWCPGDGRELLAEYRRKHRIACERAIEDVEPLK